ncbi:MAG: hypothetical protein Q7T33_15580 [Dehalococcoidia bacterium]|nr:hypothetical protein [Dehalococcoidia bacterium]
MDNKARRGGRRPGAGAPRGNLNALKHGLRSKQFAAVGALLAQDPGVRRALLDIGRRMEARRGKANEVAALLLAMLFDRANQVADGRLNVDTRSDDWRAIKQAAARLGYEATPKNENDSPDNQTADTPLGNQPDA